MGDINFDIFKDVDLNKTVNLEINKDVTVTVVNPDQLATAEADAEAFGPNALAEVDAYTLVTPPTPDGCQRVDSLIDVLGNSVNFTLGTTITVPADIEPVPSTPPLTEDVNIAETITVDFTSAGSVEPGLPDVDDINGFGKLTPLSSPPPATPDALIPNPQLSFGGDLQLVYTGDFTIITKPEDVVEAEYELTEDLVISFGTRTLDLNCEEGAGTGELTLTIPAGTEFLVEYIGATEIPPEVPPEGAIEIEFESFVDNDDDGLINQAYWTFDADPNNVETFGVEPGDPDFLGQLPDEPFIPGIFIPAGTYLVPGFGLVIESLQDPELGNISDWALEAEGIFYMGGPGDGGTAFAYAESTAALDIA